MDQAGNPALPGDTSQVYAVVVNWNRPADTITCLESLASQQNVHLHVLVVDNGSTDGSAAQIQAAFPEVEMVRSPENLGYGPGANLGIRRALQAGAEYILLLNNDATIAQDALSQLLKYDQDGVGILAPLIYYAAPPDRIWSAGGDTHPLTLEKSSPYRNKTDPGGWPETIARDFIPGTAILVPGRVFEEIGIFDEQFRMYYDDADFCERIRRAGLSILVIPQAKAWHQVSASSGGSDSPNERYWMARSSVSFFRKFAAPWQWIAIIPYRLGSAFRTSFRLLRRGAYPAIAAYWRGLYDGLRRRPT